MRLQVPDTLARGADHRPDNLSKTKIQGFTKEVSARKRAEIYRVEAAKPAWTAAGMADTRRCV